jgi:hypothetical protein
MEYAGRENPNVNALFSMGPALASFGSQISTTATTTPTS